MNLQFGLSLGGCKKPRFEDNSVATAAEAEFICGSIGEVMMHLNDAKVAAGAERIKKAKEHLQMALDCLSEIVED